MPAVRRLLTVTALSAGLLVAPLAVGASAHVTVNAPGATQGGFTKLVFRAPTEKDVATTAVEIAFPQEAPLAFANVKPKAGWTYEVVKGAPAEPFEAFGEPVEEVVQRIVWTTQGPGILPGEFDEFEVSAGPLPQADSMVFRALQTYADGEVVRWIEDGQDAEKPAPVLELAAADGDAAAGAHGGSASAAPETEVDAAPVSAESDAGSGTAIAALVVAGAALLTALASLVTGRRRA